MEVWKYGSMEYMINDIISILITNDYYNHIDI
jgi:hypothetical protein